MKHFLILLVFILNGITVFGASDSLVDNLFQQKYDSLKISGFSKPDVKIFKLALTGYYNLKADSTKNLPQQILTIINYDAPSSKKRLWVIDMSTLTIQQSILVAHGKNSGELYAKSFSNKTGSYKTSLGFFITGSTYQGKHGLSLYLNGVEKGINDKARNRAIVMHCADYVSHSFVKKYGRLGRSHGCPAISNEKIQVINDIANGSCLFAYSEKYSSTLTQLSDEAKLLLGL